jgi:hypothetical protein
MGKIKNGFQFIIVRTSFPPFVFFYKVFYILTVKIMTHFIKRIKGVETVYLRRGVAKNEIIYGLSDIDLSILISKKNVASVKTKILSLYNKLSFFLPLFAGGKEEIGIYSKEEFFNLYAENPFFKFRFQKGKSEWKLLYGKDIVNELPDCKDTELYVPAIEELKLWWYRLNFEFQKMSNLPEFKRSYLWVKAIADACQINLFICQKEKIKSREKSLEKIKGYSDCIRIQIIEELQSHLKNLTLKKSIKEEELLALYMDLTTEAIHKSESEIPQMNHNKRALLKTVGYNDLIIGKNTTELMTRIEDFMNTELQDFLSFLALFPQVYFGPDIFFNTDIDSLNLVLMPKKFIPLDKLRVLKSLLEENFSLQHIDIFMNYRFSSFSIRTDAERKAIKIPGQDPLFFSLFKKCSFAEIKEEKTQEFFSEKTPNFNFLIKRRAEMIENVLFDRDIYKMSPLNFSRFFWAAARTKDLNSSLNNDIIHIPLNSSQIMILLEEHYPGSEWLSEFYKEYRKTLQGMESDTYRFYDQLLDFLKRM